MQLSKTESLAIENLKKNKLEVFKLNDIALLLEFDKTKTYNLIKALKKKKIIEAVSSGILPGLTMIPIQIYYRQRGPSSCLEIKANLCI